MSASSQNTADIVTIRPHYVNNRFVHEVGVVSSRQFEDGNHYDNAIVDESQLIECVKLSSSEIEAKHIRVSVDLSEDAFESNAGESNDCENETQDQADDTYVYEKDAEDFVSSLDPDTDDTSLFYETQTDETTLIKYAKLADDSRGEAAKLLHDAMCPNSEETKLFLESMEEGEGFITPANSFNGDAETEKVTQKQQKCYDHQGKQIVSHSNAGEIRNQVKLYKDRYAAPVTKQASKTTDVSAVVDEAPVDRDFQRLVDEVVKHLQDCDLDEILSMFSGSGILEMTGLVPPTQLMNILQRHRLVSRDNLHHLQELIMRLDDTDLFIRAVQYTRHHHDIIYFYQDQDIPTKGFGKIQCFISGKDFTRLTREELELVRFKTASLIFVPAHFVYIVGIEPGQRIVVTLMLQERYVQEISEMVREGLPELSLANVEAVQIFDKTYSTKGTTALEKYRDKGHTSFLSVYQQLRNKSKRLEERDAEVTKLREDAELMQLELETMGAELQMLTEKAVWESVARRHIRHRPARNHSRTRTYPPSNGEEPSDKQFTLALESAVIAKAKPCFALGIAHDTKKVDKMSLDSKSADRELYSAVSRPGCKTSEMFQETNNLMSEIETILAELNSVNGP